jgi:translation initiation factor 2 subunit 3
MTSIINFQDQPMINIGLIGHVSHGKSTVVKTLTGIETFKFSTEKIAGITMKLGYANCKIFKCITCPEPQAYQPFNSKTKEAECDICNNKMTLVHHFSFIDCPGHQSLMSTMMSGATVMDCAILLIDGSQSIPQPQTVEHLAAIEIMNVKKVIIVHNKLDLITGDKATEQFQQIKDFVKGTCAEDAPIVPISAQRKYNIDFLCEFIVKYFDPATMPAKPIDRFRMNIIRSFDVNKPGTIHTDLVGGVAGGSIITGSVATGTKVEIRPGLVTKDSSGNTTWKAIHTTIVSMKTDTDVITTARPGGLIGVGTLLDPILTRTDRLAGQVVGLPGQMPEVYTTIQANCIFMKKSGDQKVVKPVATDKVVLNISSKTVQATVKSVKKNVYVFDLNIPCCIDIGEKFAVSVKLDNGWRLIGLGELIG